jgi:hypothetical protein
MAAPQDAAQAMMENPQAAIALIQLQMDMFHRFVFETLVEEYALCC